MIGYLTRFRENDYLPLWQGLAAKKKPPFCNASTLITREIMRSRDAQCNSGGMTLTRKKLQPARVNRATGVPVPYISENLVNKQKLVKNPNWLEADQLRHRVESMSNVLPYMYPFPCKGQLEIT